MLRRRFTWTLLASTCLAIGCVVDEGTPPSPGTEAPADPTTDASDGTDNENLTDSGSAKDEDSNTSTGPRCDPNKPFGPLEVLAVTATSALPPNVDLMVPSLGDDERSLVFHAMVHRYDLFMAQRPSKDAPWGAPEKMPFSTAEDELAGSLSPDGLTLWFATSGPKPARSRRSSTAEPFTTKEAVSLGLNIKFSAPREMPSGRLYFVGWSSDSSAPQPFLLYRTTKDLDTTPVVILEGAPSLVGYAITADERTLFVTVRARDSARHETYRMTRPDVAKPFAFGDAVLVPELQPPPVPSDEDHLAVSWISADECVVYGTILRDGTRTALAMATRGK